MGRSARGGILVLMGLAIGLARLVEVELDPGAPPAVLTAKAAAPDESPSPAPTVPAALARTAVAGPASPDAEPPVTVGVAPRQERVHVVAAGETLGTIARKVYGSSKHWKTILDANKDVMATPEKMRVGMRLRLPAQPSVGSGGTSRR